MLKEAWQYVSTRTTLPEARKMGYLSEAIAMQARRQRCASSWESHYQQCQQAILTLAKQCSQKRTIVILGAGSLRDIPLARLSADFKKVILVDIVFLAESRQFAKHYPNVELKEGEITGWSAPILSGELRKPSRIKATLVHLDKTLNSDVNIGAQNLQKNARLPSPARQLAFLLSAEPEVDAVVSLNLLTQIPLIPVRWLIDHYQLPEKLAGEVGKMIVRQHLAWLQGLRQVGANICLIADREDVEFDADGKLVDSWDPTWEASLPEPDMSWWWTVMPLGEASRERGQKNRVGVNFLNEFL